MATRPGGPQRMARPVADNDVYTGLLFVALLFVLFATIFVGYKAVTLFGGLLPPGGA
jgi:hypothetical protein